jgi:hypothetical protein
MSIPLVNWKYWTHRSNCGRKGVLPLTLEQYKEKLSEAGISAEQIGNIKGMYQLSRYSDRGNYTPDSCRFVTKEINYAEQILNGGIARGAIKKTGRNKYNHSGIAIMAEKKSKPFIVVNPKGMVIEGKNLNEFCKQNKLNQGCMFCVINGLKKSYKGWTSVKTDKADQSKIFQDGEGI